MSTNSLAATDAFIVYALSHKYKRRYLREFGFHIYEFKPFPGAAPIDLAAIAAGAEEDSEARGTDRRARRNEQRRTKQRPAAAGRSTWRRVTSAAAAAAPTRRCRCERAGVRIGLHAKSMVVDERIGVVGTHNFDPRGDHYNTESAVVIEDPAFARALAASIRRDMRRRMPG